MVDLKVVKICQNCNAGDFPENEGNFSGGDDDFVHVPDLIKSIVQGKA